MTDTGPLTGIGVLVTRPAAQATSMLAQLHAWGAQPMLFPALATVGLEHSPGLHAYLAHIADYHRVIFVSPNAVNFGLTQIPADTRVQIKAVAVGKGTAKALRAAGCQNILTPETGADSEHLLALPEFEHLLGQRMLIVRGQGGRELIANSLRTRGAEVDYAECYRRICPDTDPAPLLAALMAKQIHASTVFSSETLDNLLGLLPSNAVEAIRELPLFVPHTRIAQHAQTKIFTRIIVTNPGEPGLLAGLVEYFAHDRIN